MLPQSHFADKGTNAERLSNSTKLGKGAARTMNPSLPDAGSRQSGPVSHVFLKAGQARRLRKAKIRKDSQESDMRGLSELGYRFYEKSCLKTSI